MSKTLTKQPTSSLASEAAVVVVDPELSAKLLAACQEGNIDACHLALLHIQRTYPQSVQQHNTASRTGARTNVILERHVHQPVCDLVGHGFTVAASSGHVEMVEFFLSSHYAEALRDGVCGDPQRFPIFGDFELQSCFGSIRFVCYAALTCIDQLSMPGFRFLVETQALCDFEASLCLSLAMQRALAVVSGVGTTSGSVSLVAFHSMIVLLASHYDFLVEEIRQFHELFHSRTETSVTEFAQLEVVRALQASLLYEIVLSGI